MSQEVGSPHDTAAYSMRNWSFLTEKANYEDGHSPPSRADVKCEELYLHMDALTLARIRNSVRNTVKERAIEKE